MVRDYLKERVFERPVDLDDKVVLRRLAENDAQELVGRARSCDGDPRAGDHRARADDRRERPPGLGDATVPVVAEDGRGQANGLQPDAGRQHLEARFAKFLDRATDVAAWAKLTMNSRFALEYISKAGALRYYYPDFVVRLTDDTCLIIETKGQEDIDVALKDRRARRWCEDATRLAGRDWAYEKVPQKLFDSFNGDRVEALRRFLHAATRVAERASSRQSQGVGCSVKIKATMSRAR